MTHDLPRAAREGGEDALDRVGMFATRSTCTRKEQEKAQPTAGKKEHRQQASSGTTLLVISTTAVWNPGSCDGQMLTVPGADEWHQLVDEAIDVTVSTQQQVSAVQVEQRTFPVIDSPSRTENKGEASDPVH